MEKGEAIHISSNGLDGEVANESAMKKKKLLVVWSYVLHHGLMKANYQNEFS